MNRFVQLPKFPNGRITATICSLTQDHVEQIDVIWRDILLEADQADIGWDWGYKLRLALGDSRYETYGLEFDGLLQGVTLLDIQGHRSWLPQRFSLVYVEYVASAPWNRRLIEDPPYLRQVGRTLLAVARQRSVELGYQGRVGLHSLPEVEGFYHHMKMPDYGPDPDKDGLVYFEYPALQS
ncbi:GNAT family N-acetyltransferase [Adonisia turfae]|uniref:GNAT family N-acetyltransferase n=1 Tax=Adonisia turfae TaxID=2950184 RepID=UPI002029ACD7|nr:GNAT family N-acetyltransferase [Adonisia turfae]